jgi:prophage antirepressor-like protein
MCVRGVSDPNVIHAFEFEGKPIRICGSYEEPLFIMVDAREALGMSKDAHTKFLKQLAVGHIHEVEVLDVRGVLQPTKAVGEADFYRFVFQSRKATAAGLRNWIFEDVIPTLRKEGQYVMQPDVANLIEDLVPKTELLDQYDQLRAKYKAIKEEHVKAIKQQGRLEDQLQDEKKEVKRLQDLLVDQEAHMNEREQDSDQKQQLLYQQVVRLNHELVCMELNMKHRIRTLEGTIQAKDALIDDLATDVHQLVHEKDQLRHWMYHHPLEIIPETDHIAMLEFTIKSLRKLAIRTLLKVIIKNKIRYVKTPKVMPRIPKDPLTNLFLEANPQYVTAYKVSKVEWKTGNREPFNKFNGMVIAASKKLKAKAGEFGVTVNVRANGRTNIYDKLNKRIGRDEMVALIKETHQDEETMIPNWFVRRHGY